MTTTTTRIEVQTDERANSIIANVAQGLGFQVWHKFSGTAVTPAELRVRCVANGLDADCIPQIDPIVALRRAVRDFRMTETVQTVVNGTQKTVERARVRAEIVAANDREIVVGILRHERVNAKRVRKEQSDTLVWDVNAKTWTELGSTDFAEPLRNKIAHAQSYFDGNDVRVLVVKPALARAGALTIKDGIYFVPGGGSDELVRAQQILDGIDSFRLIAASLPAGMGWEAPLGDEARDALSNDLEALLAQIEGWENQSRRVSENSEAHVFARFAELHERAESYEAALSVTLDDLRDRIDQMRERAREAVEAREADAEQKSSARKSQKRAERAEQKRVEQQKSQREIVDEQVAALDDDAVLEALDALAPGEHDDATIEQKRVALVELLVALA